MDMEAAGEGEDTGATGGAGEGTAGLAVGVSVVGVEGVAQATPTTTQVETDILETNTPGTKDLMIWASRSLTDL